MPLDRRFWDDAGGSDHLVNPPGKTLRDVSEELRRLGYDDLAMVVYVAVTTMEVEGRKRCRRC